RFGEVGRHPFTRRPREDRAHFALERLRVGATREGERCVRQSGPRQWIERKLGGDRLALWHQSVEIEAAAAEYVGEHFEGGEVGLTRTRCARGDHERAARTVGIDGEGGRLPRTQVYRRLRREPAQWEGAEEAR